MGNTIVDNTLVAALIGLSLSWATALQALPIDARTGKTPARAEATPESAANAEFRKGVAAALKGKNGAAKDHFQVALKLEPKFVAALIGLADLAQREGNTTQTGEYLKQAEKLAPRSAEVHLAWGRFHLAGRRLDTAEASFRLARDLNPGAIAPLLELGDLYLTDLARRVDAVDAYRAAVERAPEHKIALQSLGVALALIGKRKDALDAFERAAAAAPKDPVPLRAAGRLYVEAGELDKALNAFDRGLKRQPDFVPLMLDRGDALGRQGKWAEAISQVETAARAAPKSAEVQIKLGDICQGGMRWDCAKLAYGKAIGLDAKNPFAYNNLAWMLVQQGSSPEKAVESAKKAVSLAQNSAPFYDTLGWAQRAAGDLAGAGESLRRATDIEPKSAEFQYHYGIVLMELKNIREARSALERALDPRFPKVEEVRKLLRSMPKEN